MKKTIFIAFSSLIFHFANGQKEVTHQFKVNELIGKWKISCGIKPTISEVSYCTFCSDWIVTKDSITLTAGNDTVTTTVPYFWDAPVERYSFYLNKRHIILQLYWVGADLLLQSINNDNDCIMLLKRKEEVSK